MKTSIKQLWIALLLLSVGVARLTAQELNAKVTINTQKLPGSDKQVFNSLQTALERLINGTKWTEATFANSEKIDCTFTFILHTATPDGLMAGEVQVTASRPVYNASYISSTFNFRDTDLTFRYTEGEPLEYTPNNIDNNLVAMVAFYTYIIIGLDFDSFSPNGGKAHFQTAMQIVNASQGAETKGWAAFDSDKNRHALALALTEDGTQDFHRFWYEYHRLGLDDMSLNINRGRQQIASAVERLPGLQNIRTASVILQLIGDSKLEEVAQVFEHATDEESRKSVYKALSNLFPTRMSVVNKLKN